MNIITYLFPNPTTMTLCNKRLIKNQYPHTHIYAILFFGYSVSVL